MPANDTLVRIFVSSTFQDFRAERDALQALVFPRVRELCQRLGKELHAIDLRWGVSHHDVLEHRTIPICMDEIDRCLHPTVRSFFIVLLGDRYGTRLLPPAIADSEFNRILKHLSPPDRERLEALYPPDLNALRPTDVDGSFETERRLHSTGEDARLTADDHAELCRTLERAGTAAGLSARSLAMFQTSITHQEVERILEPTAAKSDAQPDILVCVRRLDQLPAPSDLRSDDVARAFSNSDELGVRRREDLEADLRRRIPSTNIVEYRADWRGTPAPITTAHIGTLSDDLDQCLAQAAIPTEPGDDLCADVFRWLATALHADHGGEHDPLHREVEAHRMFATDRCADFVGRAPELAAIADYVHRPEGRLLTLVGASGTGKSALLAEAIRTTELSLGAELVYRFAGASADASDERTLLEGICQQIDHHYHRQTASSRLESSDLAGALERRLAMATPDRPLVLVVDALDQLTHRGPARLEWIPRTLPAHVSMIVSALPGAHVDALRGKASRMLELLPLPHNDAGDLLDRWLARAARTLQPSQREIVLAPRLGGIAPLWLRFAFEEARGWSSDHDGAELPEDVGDLLAHVTFPRLRHLHGNELVDRCLALLAAAKHGLSEAELTDLLEGDLETAGAIQHRPVLNEIRERSPDSPPTSALPPVVWSRFWADVVPYLSERSAEGRTLFGFYHRQFEDAVRWALLSGPGQAPPHRDLARYFSSRSNPSAEAVGSTRDQRVLTELPYQQILGGLLDGATATLSDVGFLTDKALGPGIDAVLDDLSLAVETAGLDALRPVRETLEREAHVFRTDSAARRPELLAQQLLKGAVMLALDPLVEAARRFLDDLGEPHLAVRWTVGTDALRPNFVDGDAAFTHVMAMTPDGQRGVFGMADDTLMTRDFGLDAPSRRSAPMKVSAGLTDVAISGDGKRVVATCGGPTQQLVAGEKLTFEYVPGRGAVSVWDLERNTLLWERSHEGGAWRVRVTPDGDSAVTAGLSVIVWDLNTGEPRLELPRRDVGYRSVVISNDGALVTADTRSFIEGSGQRQQFTTWSVASGEIVNLTDCDLRLEGHEATDERVLAMSSSGRWVLFASKLRTDDWVAQVWDLHERHGTRPLHHGPAAGDPSTSEGLLGAITEDGLRCVTGSRGRLILWDLHSGTGRAAELPPGRCQVALIRDGREACFAARNGTHARVTFVYGGGVGSSTDEADEGPIAPVDLQSTLSHTGLVEALAITSDGTHVVTGSRDSLLRVLNVETGRIVNGFGSPTWSGSDSSCIALGSGRLAAISSLDGIFLRDVSAPDREGQPEIGVPRARFRQLAISPDDSFVCAASHGTVERWRWNSRTSAFEHFQFAIGSDDWVQGLAITPDDRVVVHLQDPMIRTYDLLTGQQLQSIPLQERHPAAHALMPSGKEVVVGYMTGALHIVHLDTGHTRVMADDRDGQITSISVSTDGSFMAVAHGDERCVKVWDVATGAVSALLSLRSRPYRVALTGSRLVVGDDVGSVYCMDFVSRSGHRPAVLV